MSREGSYALPVRAPMNGNARTGDANGAGASEAIFMEDTVARASGCLYSKVGVI
jgi:hypothetical protein